MVIEGAAGVAGVGLAGGVVAELLHWWNLREDKQLPDYAKSPKYWIITVGMILAGGFIKWFYFGKSAAVIVVVDVWISTPLVLPKRGFMVSPIGGSTSFLPSP